MVSKHNLKILKIILIIFTDIDDAIIINKIKLSISLYLQSSLPVSVKGNGGAYHHLSPAKLFNTFSAMSNNAIGIGQHNFNIVHLYFPIPCILVIDMN